MTQMTQSLYCAYSEPSGMPMFFLIVWSFSDSNWKKKKEEIEAGEIEKKKKLKKKKM